MGVLRRALAQVGVQGHYTGVDADERLLALAAEQTQGLVNLPATLRMADLADADWVQIVADQRPFDVIVCLAVLHHFPGTRCGRASCGRWLPSWRPKECWRSPPGSF